MFAALTVARLREAVIDNADTNLRNKKSWVSDDSVPPTELPLAKAMGKVLSSMHHILQRTMAARDAELARYIPDEEDTEAFKELEGEERQAALKKRRFLRETKAAEVRLVRNVRFLRQPEKLFEAKDWAA